MVQLPRYTAPVPALLVPAQPGEKGAQVASDTQLPPHAAPSAVRAARNMQGCSGAERHALQACTLLGGTAADARCHASHCLTSSTSVQPSVLSGSQGGSGSPTPVAPCSRFTGNGGLGHMDQAGGH